MKERPAVSVAFRVTADEEAPRAVEPYVAGVALSDLAAAYEQKHGLTPAAGYGALVPDHFNFGDLASYFRGEKRGRWPQPGRVWLLGCDCGEVGCWPLEASVTTSDNAVTWSDFRQPHRPERTYDDFGPFTFDRTQYEAAVAEAQSVLRDGGS